MSSDSGNTKDKEDKTKTNTQPDKMAPSSPMASGAASDAASDTTANSTSKEGNTPNGRDKADRGDGNRTGGFRGSVGPQARNHSADVRAAQSMLAEKGAFDLSNRGDPLGTPDGFYGAALEKSIKSFQKDKGLKVDGVINPGGPTETALAAQDKTQFDDAPDREVSSGPSTRGGARRSNTVRQNPAVDARSGSELGYVSAEKQAANIRAFNEAKKSEAEVEAKQRAKVEQVRNQAQAFANPVDAVGGALSTRAPEKQNPLGIDTAIARQFTEKQRQAETQANRTAAQTRQSVRDYLGGQKQGVDPTTRPRVHSPIASLPAKPNPVRAAPRTAPKVFLASLGRSLLSGGLNLKTGLTQVMGQDVDWQKYDLIKNRLDTVLTPEETNTTAAKMGSFAGQSMRIAGSVTNLGLGDIAASVGKDVGQAHAQGVNKTDLGKLARRSFAKHTLANVIGGAAGRVGGGLVTQSVAHVSKLTPGKSGMVVKASELVAGQAVSEGLVGLADNRKDKRPSKKDQL